MYVIIFSNIAHIEKVSTEKNWFNVALSFSIASFSSLLCGQELVGDQYHDTSVA